MLGNRLVVQRLPIDQLKPVEPRLRVHPKKQIEKLQRGLGQFGQVLPIPVTPDLRIIDLELVCQALKNNGESHADVVIVEVQTEENLLALRNDGNLRTVLVNFDIDLTGFSSPEVDFRLGADVPGANVEQNGSDIPRIERTAISVPGRIWQLRKHRVDCGDATDAMFVAQVLDGSLAAVAFTDPPRNIGSQRSISRKGRRRPLEFVQRTGELDEDLLCEFLRKSIIALKASCAPHALALVCTDWRSITTLNVAARWSGMPLYNMCVWTKTNGGMGGIYRNAHELVPVYRAGEQTPLNNVELGRHGRRRTNVWDYAGITAFDQGREAVLASPTRVKPIALVADALREVTKRGNLVIDTFLGSGTTIMAAHETGRVCYGTELNPLYVDLIGRRWQAATGRKAVRVDTGEPFNSEVQKLLMTDEFAKCNRQIPA